MLYINQINFNNIDSVKKAYVTLYGYDRQYNGFDMQRQYVGGINHYHHHYHYHHYHHHHRYGYEHNQDYSRIAPNEPFNVRNTEYSSKGNTTPF
jgi:hypothetical protein